MTEETKRYIDNLKEGTDKKNKSEDSLDSSLNWKKSVRKANLNITKEAEKQKRKLRDALTVAIKHIIWFQLVFFNIVVITIVLAVTSKIPCFKDIDKELSIQLFSFLKYYISATIVELLGMLVFILHYVFSDFRVSERLLSEIKNKEK